MAAQAQQQQQQTGDGWKTYTVQCRGGLNTSEDTLSYLPGEATQLINFEPGVYGGYRRISGYQKYDTAALPGTGNVLGVCVWNGTGGPGVIGCRQNDVYFSTGTGWNTHINGVTARTGAGRYMFTKYYYAGTKIVVMCDGVNPAGRWDGTSYSLINGTGAPTNPKYATFFSGCLVLAGYTSGGGLDAFSISAGTADTDFVGTDGAVEIKVGDKITGIRAFRDTLYIFCQRSIYAFGLTASSTSNTIAQMSVTQVATGIGCVCYDSIQEVNGDLTYLAEDGIRTLAGTMKLNDVELGTISKPILNTANQVDRLIGGNPDNVNSVVIREKNQYRLFYSPAGQPQNSAQGILGAIRPGKQMMTQFGTYISIWEWATMQGLQPYCCDSDLTGTEEIVVHGGIDGFVYQQEIDGAFNGSPVTAVYTTAPLQFDDPELRKLLQKITVYAHPEGNMNVNAQVIYDFNDSNTAQPPSVALSSSGTGSQYGDTTYGTGIYGGSTTTPLLRINVVGSGKMVQVSFTSNDTNPPYSIQGISFNYRPLGRR